MIDQAAPVRPRRSVLYVPAVNARAVAKARTLPCDVVVLDLEDAVGPDDKAAARAAALGALREGGFAERELAIRCNGLRTPWGRADIEALAAAGAPILVLPKVEGRADIHAAEALTRGGARLWAMIETCRAVLSLADIAETARTAGLEALMLGTNDL